MRECLPLAFHPATKDAFLSQGKVYTGSIRISTHRRRGPSVQAIPPEEQEATCDIIVDEGTVVQSKHYKV